MANDKVTLELPVDHAVVLRLACGLMEKAAGIQAGKETDPMKAIGHLSLEKSLAALAAALNRSINVESVAPAAIAR